MTVSLKSATVWFMVKSTPPSAAFTPVPVIVAAPALACTVDFGSFDAMVMPAIEDDMLVNAARAGS